MYLLYQCFEFFPPPVYGEVVWKSIYVVLIQAHSHPLHKRRGVAEDYVNKNPSLVIPAQAGIQALKILFTIV